MIIPVQSPRLGVGLFNQLHPIPTHALVVNETAELRIVQHVESALEVLHAEDGMQAFCEDGDPPVGMKANHASSLLARVLGADVHWVFRHEDAAVRSRADNGRMTDL